MEEAEWKVELMACNKKTLKDKPLSELLSDVNYLTDQDLSLIAACDNLAGTCSNLMRIHGGQGTSNSTNKLKNHRGSLLSPGIPQGSPRECGEGESSDEVAIEIPGRYHDQWHPTNKYNHPPNTSQQNLSVFSRPTNSEWPGVKINGRLAKIQDKERGDNKVHIAHSGTKHRDNTRAVPMKNSPSAKQKLTKVSSCKAPRHTMEDGQGLVKRINTSSELTSRLNDSMDILRQQLDRIFDSTISIASSHNQFSQVDAAVHCDLDIEPTRESSPTLTHLNMSDQGYCSDGSTLDSTRAAHFNFDGELLSPGSLDSDAGTPIDPLSPSKGTFSYSPLSRLGSLHSSSAGIYPEGIVKNSMSPRSAFKKVVRFSQ